jgi:hypothetical protein
MRQVKNSEKFTQFIKEQEYKNKERKHTERKPRTRTMKEKQEKKGQLRKLQKNKQTKIIRKEKKNFSGERFPKFSAIKIL